MRRRDRRPVKSQNQKYIKEINSSGKAFKTPNNSLPAKATITRVCCCFMAFLLRHTPSRGSDTHNRRWKFSGLGQRRRQRKGTRLKSLPIKSYYTPTTVSHLMCYTTTTTAAGCGEQSNADEDDAFETCAPSPFVSSLASKPHAPAFRL